MLKHKVMTEPGLIFCPHTEVSEQIIYEYHPYNRCGGCGVNIVGALGSKTDDNL